VGQHFQKKTNRQKQRGPENCSERGLLPRGERMRTTPGLMWCWGSTGGGGGTFHRWEKKKALFGGGNPQNFFYLPKKRLGSGGARLFFPPTKNAGGAAEGPPCGGKKFGPHANGPGPRGMFPFFNRGLLFQLFPPRFAPDLRLGKGANGILPFWGCLSHRELKWAPPGGGFSFSGGTPPTSGGKLFGFVEDRAVFPRGQKRGGGKPLFGEGRVYGRRRPGRGGGGTASPNFMGNPLFFTGNGKIVLGAPHPHPPFPQPPPRPFFLGGAKRARDWLLEKKILHSFFPDPHPKKWVPGGPPRSGRAGGWVWGVSLGGDGGF